ncbi:MAG: hypothetical protein ACKPKO_62350 [Candidatus Fonsibacter sp.]
MIIKYLDNKKDIKNKDDIKNDINSIDRLLVKISSFISECNIKPVTIPNKHLVLK